MPVRITADHLRYEEAQSQTRFSGNVQVRQDTSTLYADELVTSNRKETGRARGNVMLVDEKRKIRASAGQVDYANKLNEAEHRDGVRVFSVDPYGISVTVTAASGHLWPAAGKASLAGGVQAYRRDASATARAAEVDQDAGLLILKEGVSVHLGENQFRSNKAVFKQQGDSLALEGDVRARFVPSQLEDAARISGDKP
jgi:lipopolysaccharide export system protein LptA